MDGRKVSFLNANEGNNFLPMREDLGTDEKVDILYLCSPNNPTGACYNKDQLQTWVDFANAQGAVIFFDSAYEVFASGTDLPRTIFAIPGARTCAIEIASLSKTAGFTGTRCSYTGCAKRTRSRWSVSEGYVVPSPVYEIQRHAIHCSEGGCCCVH